MSDQLTSKCFQAGYGELIAILPTALAAKELDERFREWPIEWKLHGRLIRSDAERGVAANGHL